MLRVREMFQGGKNFSAWNKGIISKLLINFETIPFLFEKYKQKLTSGCESG